MTTEGVKQPGEQEDRRQSARFPASPPISGHSAEISEGQAWGVVRNISAGGLMAEFPVEVLQGSTLDLVLETQHGPVVLEGRVVWTAVTGEGVFHGLAFLEPKAPDFALNLFSGETGAQNSAIEPGDREPLAPGA